MKVSPFSTAHEVEFDSVLGAVNRDFEKGRWQSLTLPPNQDAEDAGSASSAAALGLKSGRRSAPLRIKDFVVSTGVAIKRAGWSLAFPLKAATPRARSVEPRSIRRIEPSQKDGLDYRAATATRTKSSACNCNKFHPMEGVAYPPARLRRTKSGCRCFDPTETWQTYSSDSSLSSDDESSIDVKEVWARDICPAKSMMIVQLSAKSTGLSDDRRTAPRCSGEVPEVPCPKLYHSAPAEFACSPVAGG